jgi:RNA polymerase sigma-70 factor (ECF subfamily)
VVRRADRAALAADRPLEVRGARQVVEESAVFGRNARFAAVAWINGGVGLVIAPRGHVQSALTFIISSGRIAGYELIGDPARLARLNVRMLPD